MYNSSGMASGSGNGHSVPIAQQLQQQAAQRRHHNGAPGARDSDASVYDTLTSPTAAHQAGGIHQQSQHYSDSGAMVSPGGSGADDDQLRRFHAQGGGYTHLANPAQQHHHSSEPPSPTMLQANQGSPQDDNDRDSNGDSSSNGSTKVDSRSPSAYRVGRPGYMGHSEVSSKTWRATILHADVLSLSAV